jgi:hypothetical protein
MLCELSDLSGVVEVKLAVVEAAVGVADLMVAAAAMDPPPHHGAAGVALA